MPEEHALLSASASHKWLHCPPSARLEYEKPDETSEYALAGTLAHKIGELKLTKEFVDRNMSSQTFSRRLNKLKKDPSYDPVMDRNTDAYVDYIKDIAFKFPAQPMVAVEKKVDYSPWAPEGFGTSDCILIHGQEIHVIDYKNGQGVPVSAYDNPQMKLYALGALNAYGMLFPIEKVCLHIVQPNLDNFSSFELSVKALREWGEQIRPVAELAFEGKGEFCQGDWCNSCFCRLRATCRARMDANMSLMDDAVNPLSGKTNPPAEISHEEIGKILKKAMFLENWVKSLKSYAQDTIVSGGEIPGWKIIEGRSNRVITDKDAAAQKLTAAGYEEAVIYKPRELLGLTDLTKLVGKDDFKKYVEPYVEKPQGKPTLAPEDDKRPAMQLKPSAEDAFGGENTYKEANPLLVQRDSDFASQNKEEEQCQ